MLDYVNPARLSAHLASLPSALARRISATGQRFPNFTSGESLLAAQIS